MKRGKLVLVLGPSGSGKNTLIAHARETYPDLYYPVSCTTRSMRGNEVEGTQYYFLSRPEFEKRISEDAFLEWAEYGSNYYGTLHSEVDRKLAEGALVLSDIEAQGARQLQTRLPKGELAIIYIDAGSWEDLAKRIKDRAPISDEELEKRHARYEDEVTMKDSATVVINNHDGDLVEAKKDFVQALALFRQQIGTSL